MVGTIVIFNRRYHTCSPTNTKFKNMNISTSNVHKTPKEFAY